jgi:hypothetical protein
MEDVILLSLIQTIIEENSKFCLEIVEPSITTQLINLFSSVSYSCELGSKIDLEDL